MIKYLILILLLWGCATGRPRNITNVCSIFKDKSGWHGDCLDASKKWGIPMHVIMAFIYQESKFDSDAKPPRGKNFLWIFPGKRISSAYGYAQVIDGTWERYMRATDNYGADRDDFEDATDFIGWYLNHVSQSNRIKKSDIYNLYLAYHEGNGGYRRKSYRKKPWLLKVAKNVKKQARRYRHQYASCKDDFKRWWLWRLLF